MRKYITFLAAVLIFGGIFAMSTANRPASAFSLTGLFNALVVERGINVKEGIAYGPLPRHKLDIYTPSTGKAGGPVAFFVYGGGWKSGERATYKFVGHALAARGITTVIADYRLFPEVRFPAFVEDAALAYAWTQTNVATSDGQARPVIVIGHSAGAHIGALLAFDERYLNPTGKSATRPVGIVGLAGPYAFNPVTWESTKDIFAGVTDHGQARPVTFVSAKAPPALLFHGLADKTVKLWNMRELTSRLRQEGVPVRKRELNGIGHIGLILTLARPFRWRAPVLDEVVAFIKQRAGSPAAGQATITNP